MRNIFFELSKLFIFLLNNLFPEKNIAKIKRNLSQNFLLPISGFFYFVMHLNFNLNDINVNGQITSLALIFLMLMLISSQSESLVTLISKSNNYIKIFALLSSFGIINIARLDFRAKLVSLFSNFDISKIRILTFFISLLSFVFIFLCLIYLYTYLLRIIVDNNLFGNVNRIECFVYAALLILVYLYITIVFYKTDAFYSPKYRYDAIFTSDSGYISSSNSYMNLLNVENDLRQPLFAVFAAPFTSIAYFAGYIFRLSYPKVALLTNFVQNLILFISTFLLAQTMNLKGIKRISFILFFYSTFTYLLFTLLMEQYVFAFFWLVLTIFLFSKEKFSYKESKLAFIGASGTLLTNIAILPITLLSENINFEQLKKKFRNHYKIYVLFLILFLLSIILFFRLDVLLNISKKTEFLSQFTGKELDTQHKIFQYFMFLRNIFITPELVPNLVKQSEVTNINSIGLLVFFISIASVLINFRKKHIKISAYWMLFSIGILVILGWGTQENGLVLYSLYFGWPYFILVYDFIWAVSKKIKKENYFPYFMIFLIITLLIINIPSMINLLKIARLLYPR